MICLSKRCGQRSSVGGCWRTAIPSSPLWLQDHDWLKRGCFAAAIKMCPSAIKIHRRRTLLLYFSGGNHHEFGCLGSLGVQLLCVLNLPEASDSGSSGAPDHGQMASALSHVDTAPNTGHSGPWRYSWRNWQPIPPIGSPKHNQIREFWFSICSPAGGVHQDPHCTHA